jgi:hypothetical protein
MGLNSPYMKLRLILLKLIIISTLLLIQYRDEIFSQGTDLSLKNKPGLFAGINLGVGQAEILNVGIQSVSELLTNKKSSFSGSVEIGYFLSNNIGLSSGIGFVTYNTQVNLSTYQNKFITTDSENESYERRISGTDIEEFQKISFLTIPITANIRLPFNRLTGFFIQPGLNLSVPLGNNYESSGIFSFKGYYAVDNVELTNLTAYDFPSNINSKSGGKLELKSLVINAIAAVGVDYYIQKNIQVAMAACYNKSLSGISEYASPDKFQLSAEPDQINSVMGGSSKVTTQAIGLRISLRYFLQ